MTEMRLPRSAICVRSSIPSSPGHHASCATWRARGANGRADTAFECGGPGASTLIRSTKCATESMRSARGRKRRSCNSNLEHRKRLPGVPADQGPGQCCCTADRHSSARRWLMPEGPPLPANGPATCPARCSPTRSRQPQRCTRRPTGRRVAISHGMAALSPADDQPQLVT
jgi:hypothetical protein